MKRLAALLIALLLTSALAAGSKDLNGSGPTDYRAYLETGYNGGVTSGIPRKTLLYAYVIAGEKIALGSSGQGLGTAAINVRNQAGTLLTSFTGAACGVIITRAQEVAGPLAITAGGYAQCSYTAASTGIYQIEFIAPNNASAGNPAPLPTTSQWTAAAGDSTIAAWDVTVYTGTTAQTGRVWTNYFALNTGTNGKVINLNVNVLTRDGYQYAIKQQLDPFGYIFFANNKGITDASNNPSYTSAIGTNASFHAPNTADTATDYTAKIFLLPPSAALPASFGGEWLKPASPTLPPTPSGLTFTGRDGTTGYAGSTGGYLTGGTFSFSNPGATNFAYRLIIPLSANGTNTDRFLLGTATPGSNSVSWDGLDGSGAAVPAGNTSYTAFVKLYGGEVHFPLLDVENSSGLTINRLTLPGTTGTDNDPYQVYWDDRGLNPIGGPTVPIQALKGVSSNPPTHVWGDATGTGFGNNNTVDTWSFYPSGPATNGSGIVVRSADIRIVKAAVSTAALRGYFTRYTLDVSNLSATPGPLSVTVTDPVPAWASSLTWTCAAACTPASGSGAVNTVVNLSGTTAVRINVSAGTPASLTSGSSVTNTASSTRANDATDPDATNNTSSVALTVRDPVTSLTLVKTQRNVTQGGTFTATNISVLPAEQIQYRLAFTVAGDKSFTAATLKDALPAQLLAVGSATLTCPNGTTGTFTPVGQLLTVDLAATCGTLNPGDTGNVVVLTRVR
jgi:hypothetical protein